MNRDFRLRLSAATLALAVSAALPAAAQEVAPPATPNADRLAEEMRTLARDPRNVRALVSAGELSARLNDPSAAAGFFARAQAIDPTNPRVLAGQAMVMVRMERPGEALRLFAQAEQRGLQMENYASDRGLAYDLVGAQAHAQREHRVAMRRNPDDDTIRRYALSLGISGHEDEAMKALDPLLRRSDRAAWRARAFILAMNGDAAGADKIAASMMGGVGTALAPFFRRLPTLNAADKAFAVHFGELRKTPARIADAQLAPPLPRIAGESGIALASAETPRRVATVPAEPRRDSTLRSESERGTAARRREREALARRTAAEAEARAAQERETQRQAELKAQQEREALAARQREAERLAAEQQAARDAETRRVAEAQARERAAAEQAARDAETQRLASQQPAAPAPATTPPAESPVVQAATTTPPPAPGFTASGGPGPAPAQAAQAQPPAPRIGGEDSVIARIIAGITIPASELGVEPMPGRRAPEPSVVAPIEIAKVETPQPKAAAEPSRAEAAKPKPEAAKPETAKARGRTTDPKASEAKSKAETKPATAKAVAKTKAKPDPAKIEPARHWVQVAGGANVGDLPKAWRGLVTKAPAEFRGKQAWTTPLRFTNRLLAGPFKTPDEAQAFVNAIGKKGVSAFAWTSEAGQKIEKLSVK